MSTQPSPKTSWDTLYFMTITIHKRGVRMRDPCRTVEARRCVSLSVVKMPTEMGLSP